jgi:hypothetical protein
MAEIGPARHVFNVDRSNNSPGVSEYVPTLAAPSSGCWAYRNGFGQAATIARPGVCLPDRARYFFSNPLNRTVKLRSGIERAISRCKNLHNLGREIYR